MTNESKNAVNTPAIKIDKAFEVGTIYKAFTCGVGYTSYKVTARTAKFITAENLTDGTVKRCKINLEEKQCFYNDGIHTVEFIRPDKKAYGITPSDIDYKAMEITELKAEATESRIGDIFKAAVKTLGEEVSESDAKFEIGKTYFVMHFLTHQTDTITVEARTAQMLTGTTSEGTRKFRICENVKGEFVKIGKDDDGYDIYIYAKNEFTTANVEAGKKAAIETAAQLGINTEPQAEEKIESLEQKRDRLQSEANETFKYLNQSEDRKKSDELFNKQAALVTGNLDLDEYNKIEAELKPINERLVAAEVKYAALTEELATVIAIIAEAEAACEIANPDLDTAIAAEVFNAVFAKLKSLPLDDLTREYIKACKNEDTRRIEIINAVFESHKADDLKHFHNDHAWSANEPEAEIELPKGFIEVATGAETDGSEEDIIDNKKKQL